MTEKRNSSLPALSVGKMADTLASAYVSLIKNGIPFKSFPAAMLWGAPGVGKSQGVR